MLRERYPYYLANRPQQPNTDLEVTNKYTGEVASRVALANKEVLDKAIAAAAKAAAPMRRLAAWQRKAVLQHLAARCRERAEEFAQQLTIEAGKPIKY
ncbi:MAG TPA: aldehyde dehydrogenase family protein, partial [Lacipirellulaceae bacterium]|nr:aldehyde dehydrogenase family protein [Lacipirellulaceae bacterium]